MACSLVSANLYCGPAHRSKVAAHQYQTSCKMHVVAAQAWACIVQRLCSKCLKGHATNCSSRMASKGMAGPSKQLIYMHDINNVSSSVKMLHDCCRSPVRGKNSSQKAARHSSQKITAAAGEAAACQQQKCCPVGSPRVYAPECGPHAASLRADISRWCLLWLL